MLLKLDVVLSYACVTMVARMPFLILNHSGSAFFSISWTELRLNHCVLAGTRMYLWLSAYRLGM